MEWLGWAAAVVLVITLFSQVKKNWQEKKLKGVNPLLYYGQAVASLCLRALQHQHKLVGLRGD